MYTLKNMFLICFAAKETRRQEENLLKLVSIPNEINIIVMMIVMLILFD